MTPLTVPPLTTLRIEIDRSAVESGGAAAGRKDQLVARAISLDARQCARHWPSAQIGIEPRDAVEGDRLCGPVTQISGQFPVNSALRAFSVNREGNTRGAGDLYLAQSRAVAVDHRSPGGNLDLLGERSRIQAMRRSGRHLARK